MTVEQQEYEQRYKEYWAEKLATPTATVVQPQVPVGLTQDEARRIRDRIEEEASG